MIRKYIPRAIRSSIKHYCNSKLLSFSQAGQDFWVYAEVFNEKENGYFLDIGSHDGLNISNTYMLEKRYNWTGICIEANPVSFADLEKNRNAICLNVCLDQFEGEVRFYSKGAASGIVDRGLDNAEVDVMSDDIIRLKTLPLIQVLKEHRAPSVIDYLSIDVEGAEERILGSFDFEAYTFRCITIERPSENLRNLLRQNHYILVREIPGLDCFYVHEEFIEQYERNLFDFYRKKHFRFSWS